MSSEPQFVLGVDLDGVVADFYEGLRPIAAEWLGKLEADPTKEVSFGLPEWGLSSDNDQKDYKDLHRFAVAHRSLFTSLKPSVGAPPALRSISNHGVRVRIITHRFYIKYLHEQTVRQTVQWLESYGIPYWDLCFMKDKAAVGADLYIDDSPHIIDALRKDNHDTIVFTNSTNRHLEAPRADSWDDATAIVLAKLEAWKNARTSRNVSGA